MVLHDDDLCMYDFFAQQECDGRQKSQKNTTLLSIRAICEYTHLPTKALK